MSVTTRIVTTQQANEWGTPILTNMKLTSSAGITEAVAREVIQVYASQFVDRDEMGQVQWQKTALSDSLDWRPLNQWPEEKKLEYDRLEARQAAIFARCEAWKADFKAVLDKHSVRCDFEDREAFLRVRSCGE